jgi:tryptophan synthase alpha chain
MGYANPLVAMGWERFAERAARAGVDGAIVPDLPLEEAEPVSAVLAAAGFDLVLLAAPTTPPEGLARIAERTRGFLYFVSVTGARAELPAELPAMLARARQHSRVPVAVGFGVSRPEQARLLAPHADGVVVGTAIVREIERSAGATCAGPARWRSMARVSAQRAACTNLRTTSTLRLLACASAESLSAASSLSNSSARGVGGSSASAA